MNKQLKQPNNQTLKDFDPANKLGLHDIAIAKDVEELNNAVSKGVTSFDEYVEVHKLEQLQESVKQFLENPGDQALQAQLTEDYEEISKITAVEKGKYVRASVHSIDQDYVLKLRQQLVNEHKVVSASEMLVVDIAVNSYFRSLRSSVICINLIQNQAGAVLSPEQTRTNLIKELNKQIEMANRQFMTALTFLKELRQPPIKVSVQAKQAFVGQNQQFNKNA